ncbi:PqqD family peptide modification chaperone [Billgrantia antri]|uniref:PqqD family peptide modification chaperone n=1 Tax=Billgrantia antri TaxID=2846777 RepID=A0ABS6ZIF7_9GAMM|nr:PqqD family peptide modification chaperone [Halomonas antri]MBW6389836.1 PqqD family peptide modification chaperone [Halomonas antri]
MTEQQLPPRRFWLAGKRAAEQDLFFREALEARGWEEGDERHWDAAWVTGMPEPAQFRNASPRRRINHFPGNAALTVKSRLHESLANLRACLVDGFGERHPLTSRLDFFPRAYVMPHDYHALQQAARDNPTQRWILKPTNASKGKGVRVLRDAGEAPLAPDWLVQEYLDHPHTIRGHKYVLRLYVLIASLAPLRVYLYRQGFAKLASEPWDPDDADNPYSQLTNPDINALNTRAEVPVEFIDLDRYRAWLREQGHDNAVLFERIEELVSLTAIAGVDAMRSRTAAVGADPSGCYELLGLDCLIDDTLKPWILECNLSPSLGTCAAPESGGLIEERIKGDLVRDLIALTGLADDKTTEATDPLADAEAELARAGGFRRLLPAADPERYLAYFSLPTPEDLALADGLAGRRVPRPKLMRRRVSEFYDDQQLALYDAESGRLYRPNDTAALIWLLATEGLDPEAIVEALGAATAEAGDTLDTEALRAEVGSTLAEWCRLGLLCQRGDEETALPEHDAAAGAPPTNDEAGQTVLLAHEQRRWALEVADIAAMERLQAGLGDGLMPLGAEAAQGLHRLALLKAAAGYALASDDTLIASRLTLPAIVPALTEFLLRQAATPGQPVIDAYLVVTPAGNAALCIASDTQTREALAALPSALRSRFSRGVRLVQEGEQVRLEPLGLPGPGAAPPAAEAFPLLPRELPVWVMAGTESAPAPPTPLSRLDALAALLPGCRTANGEPPSAETIQQLDRWLEERTCWTVAVESTLTQLGDSQPTPADAMAAGN